MPAALAKKPLEKEHPNVSVNRNPKTAQMNVRLDAALKEQGDEALARIGYTPSQMVRTIWSYAARHATEPSALAKMIEEFEEGSRTEPDPFKEKNQALHEGWSLVDEFRKTWELEADVPEDDDERLEYYERLREEAYFGRLEERDLL